MSVRFLCVWFSATLVLALVSRAQLRASSQDRCALDGVAISPTARVDLFEGMQLTQRFCSAECALAWPRASITGVARHFEVHEEQAARALDPKAAFFVRSNLNSKGGRAPLRAFADALTAAEHVRQFGGALVPNPFPENP